MPSSPALATVGAILRAVALSFFAPVLGSWDQSPIQGEQVQTQTTHFCLLSVQSAEY